VHGRYKADIPPLRKVMSPWSVDSAGCPTRTVAAIEEAGLKLMSPGTSVFPAIEQADFISDSPQDATMTTQTSSSSPTPAADPEVLPARKKSGPAKGWKKLKAAAAGLTGEAAGRAAEMIPVRLTRSQFAAVGYWRARFDGLDQGAALRALIDIGLAARPREAIDPLGIEKATHRRVQQPKAKGSK
jgi:hypothetical protein